VLKSMRRAGISAMKGMRCHHAGEYRDCRANARRVFHGIQTLRQLLPVRIESRQLTEGIAWKVPCLAIADQPRFKWRGYLIDPARNFPHQGGTQTVYRPARIA